MDWEKFNFFRLFFIWIICILLGDAAVIKKRSSKFDFPAHLLGTNYTVMDDLKPYLKYNPVDLGIDLLDDEAPMFVRKALANATLSDDVTVNQYTDHEGAPRLLKAVANFYSKFIGQELDWEKNVLITVGATEAVSSAFNGHTSPGDEWIVIQPAYTMYLPMIKMSRGIPRFTSLKQVKNGDDASGSDWVIDKKQMESLFNKKTKGILLNNPLNPLGKVYTREELEFIAGLAIKYDTLVISDEAHEWVTHKPHIRIASLPGMFERTITIGSAAKSFSVSGWRIGWAIAHANILNHVRTVHGNNLDCSPVPQQEAIAYGFEEELRNFGTPESYFVKHEAETKMKRDFIVEAFKSAGMEPVIPDGGYCMVVNWTTLKNKIPKIGNDGPALSFVKWLIENVGVLGFPMSTYYGDGHRHLGEDHVRYCFHKKDETLKDAHSRLQKLKSLE